MNQKHSGNKNNSENNHTNNLQANAPNYVTSRIRWSIQNFRTLRTEPHLELQVMAPTNQNIAFHTIIMTHKKHNRTLKHKQSIKRNHAMPSTCVSNRYVHVKKRIILQNPKKLTKDSDYLIADFPEIRNTNSDHNINKLDIDKHMSNKWN